MVGVSGAEPCRGAERRPERQDSRPRRQGASWFFLKIMLPAMLLIACVSSASVPRSTGAGSDSVRIRIRLENLLAMDRILDADRNGITSLAFGPESTLLTGSHTNATVWNLSDGSARSLAGHSFWIYSVAFSPDGSIAAIGSNGKITLWSVPSWTRTRELAAHADSVKSLAFSPDGKWLASGGWRDTDLIVWDCQTWQKARTIHVTLAGDGIRTLAFSPDGKRLAIGTEQERLLLYDVASNDNPRVLGESDAGEGERSVAFSPDGAYLAAGAGRAVQVWDLASGGSLAKLATPDGRLRSIAFSPHGGLLAGWGGKSLYLWDFPSRQLVASYKYSDEAYSIGFSLDGGWLALGIGKGLILKETGSFLRLRTPAATTSVSDLETARQQAVIRLRAQGEFESTAEYERRKKSIKKEEDKLIGEFDRRIAAAHESLRRDLEARRGQREPFSRQVSLGRYDADGRHYSMTFGGREYRVLVPPTDAKEIGPRRDRVRLEGVLMHVDASEADLDEAAIVDPATSHRYPIQLLAEGSLAPETSPDSQTISSSAATGPVLPAISGPEEKPASRPEQSGRPSLAAAPAEPATAGSSEWSGALEWPGLVFAISFMRIGDKVEGLRVTTTCRAGPGSISSATAEPSKIAPDGGFSFTAGRGNRGTGKFLSVRTAEGSFKASLSLSCQDILYPIEGRWSAIASSEPLPLEEPTLSTGSTRRPTAIPAPTAAAPPSSAPQPSRSERATSPRPSSSRTYTDAKSHIQFRYAPSWQTMAPEEAKRVLGSSTSRFLTVVVYDPADRTQNLNVQVMPVADTALTETAYQQFLTRLDVDLPKSFPEFRKLSSRVYAIDRRFALEYVFETRRPDGVLLRQRQFRTGSSGREVAITFTARIDRFEAADAICFRIVQESLQLR